MTPLAQLPIQQVQPYRPAQPPLQPQQQQQQQRLGANLQEATWANPMVYPPMNANAAGAGKPYAPLSNALALQQQQDTVAIGGGSGRNLAERLSWSPEEDAKIVASVREHGCKWRQIAAMFEGRSDDAVRNRWNRVKDLPIHNDGKEPAPKRQKQAKSAACTPSSKPNTDKAAERSRTPPQADAAESPTQESEKPERVSWSRQEDDMIVRSVTEIGNKWHKIAQRLPGRTEHAIRNRFARLQSLASRGKPILLTSGHGQPIGIQLVPAKDGPQMALCG